MKKIILITIVMLIVALSSFSILQTPKKWIVPISSKNTINPIKSDENSIKIGLELYKKNCSSCHGRTGLGNGSKSALLETFAGDFTSESFQKQTDGELFYKTKTGRGEMPSYKGKIEDEGIWNLVNFMRTFKK